MPNPDVRCPRCGRMLVSADTGWQINGETFRSGFIEVGEYEGSHYEYETNLYLYSCPCGCRFGIDESS